MITVSNVHTLKFTNKLKNLNKRMNTSIERLSSSLRINKSADDVAGIGISSGMR